MQVNVRVECPDCDRGGFYDPHCDVCGKRLDYERWQKGDMEFLPCGHKTVPNLIEEYPCPYCAGTGHIEKWMELEEFEECLRELKMQKVLSRGLG